MHTFVFKASTYTFAVSPVSLDAAVADLSAAVQSSGAAVVNVRLLRLPLSGGSGPALVRVLHIIKRPNLHLSGQNGSQSMSNNYFKLK